jgi:hypothetical protein
MAHPRIIKFNEHGEPMIVCSKCSQWKKFSEFSQDKHRTSFLKLKSSCKECQNKTNVNWLQNNKHKIKEYNAKRRKIKHDPQV